MEQLEREGVFVFPEIVRDADDITQDQMILQVDVVLSHTCPDRYIPVEAFPSGIDQSTVDNSTEEWLGNIEKKLDYAAWLCGHWHINKRFDKLQFLYHDIICGEDLKRRKA